MAKVVQNPLQLIAVELRTKKEVGMFGACLILANQKGFDLDKVDKIADEAAREKKHPIAWCDENGQWHCTLACPQRARVSFRSGVELCAATTFPGRKTSEAMDLFGAKAMHEAIAIAIAQDPIGMLLAALA